MCYDFVVTLKVIMKRNMALGVRKLKSFFSFFWVRLYGKVGMLETS